MRAVRDGDVNPNTADRWLEGRLALDERERFEAMGIPIEKPEEDLIALRARALRVARVLEVVAADLRVMCDDNITPEEATRLLERIEEQIRGAR